MHEFFGSEQYALRRPGVEIAPEPGDVVIDGGGGWGETALYFADAVGAGGLVLSFEFVADNLRLFERNMALNPHLRDQVRLVAHPIWSAPGVDLAYAPAGGQTSVAAPAGDTDRARSESIDHACAEHGIDHVDFLKLDVEGAEMEALRGAEQTIRRARPQAGAVGLPPRRGPGSHTRLGTRPGNRLPPLYGPLLARTGRDGPLCPAHLTARPPG